MLISVVIPVYQGELCLDELYRRLVASLETITKDFELVMVEDCGPDQSWAVITRLATQDPRVRGVQLSRNFGQHHAITAGIHQARGDWMVVMDCDLQDRPEEIPRLYQKALEGFEVVLARRANRQDGARKKLTSWIFYKVFNLMTDLDYDGTVANFSIVSKNVVAALRTLNESVRFYGGFLTWLGFTRAYLDVEHAPRFAGESSYTLRKLFRMAMPIIIAYSNKPLRLSVAFGLGLSGLATLAGVFLLVRAFLYGTPVMGWPSLIVSVYFSTGVIVFVLGILGLYLDRIFSEVKGRPVFVIRRSTYE